MTEKTTEDFIAQLEQLDRFLDDPNDGGTVPLDVLAERGVMMPPSADLDDRALSRTLWQTIAAMASIGIYLESTDHLSDRQLYDFLREDALRELTLLFPDDPAHGEHIDPIGGCSEEDIQIYLRYYADDETRDQWAKDFPGDPLPRKETPPFDRDRLLPTHEERLFGTEQ